MTLFSKFNRRHFIFAAICICLVWLYGRAILMGSFGLLGDDPDDVMRFVQIRDWVNGQSWFNTDQYRLGLSSGTDMHWSRIPDLPVAILAWFFDLFTTQEKALHLASAIWPPILGAILLAIFASGARHMSASETRRSTLVATLGLGLVFIALYDRFAPGALDHHNLQVVLMLGCVVSLLTVDKLKSGFIAGVAMGAAVAIGPEVYPFIALIGVFVALDWAILGQLRRDRTIGFGAGFAVSLAGLFVLTVAPAEWARSYCDQLSVVNVAVGIIGGAGLALSAWSMSSRMMGLRLLPLGIIGLLAIITIGSIAPQCFGNPLNALPETMHVFWLDHITEARPLGVGMDNPLLMVPYLAGTSCVAIIILAIAIYKRGFSSSKILFLLLLISSFGLTLYQARFFLFAQLFAILPLAAWIAICFTAGKKKGNNIGYLGATILSLPLFLAVPGVLLPSSQDASSTLSAPVDCTAPDVIAALNALPEGVLLSPTSHGSDLLKLTGHRVLSANYHRNIDGIEASIEINSAPSERAKKYIKEYDVDYIMTCQNNVLTALYTERHPNSFAAKLAKNEVPNWLSLEDATLASGGVKLYRVLK